MSDDAKCYAATPAKTIEQHIMDPNIAKNEAEWWAYHEIERLRAENEKLRAALKPFAELAPVSWSLEHDMYAIDTDDICAAKTALEGMGDD